MIDPDNILIPIKNNQTNIILKDVPEYDFIVWDLDSNKELKKYMKTIENEVRHSFEYKEYISYLREYYGMDESGFERINSKGNKCIKIEIHHYPYTLFDIVSIVYNKRCYYQESLDVELVAEEVMMLHYKLLIGLIPITITEHELMHEGKLFYPVDKIFGRWELFEELYKPWISEELLDMSQRIRQYSDDNSELMRTTEILNPNHIKYDYTPESSYKLPNFNNLKNNMDDRMIEIRNNNYMLPTINDMSDINRKDDIKDRKSIINPVYFTTN